MDLDDAIAGLQRQNQVNATKALSAKLDALQAELSRQKQEEARRKANMPDCPWCGGGIPVGFAKCKNCSCDLIWLENLVGKPGDEENLQARMQEAKFRAVKKTSRRRRCQPKLSLWQKLLQGLGLYKARWRYEDE
jgi:hypothetical protein